MTENDVAVVLVEFAVLCEGVLEACERAGVPMVVHFHGFDAYHRPTLEKCRHLYSRLFRSAAGVVAVSRAMEAQLIGLGADQARLHRITYGVDCDQFCNATPGQAPLNFVAVGRFVEKKAPHLTVLAFSQIAGNRPEARLTMIGDGPLRGPVEHLVRGLGLSERVELRGAQDHTAVADLMRTARAFVQHSVTALDGDSEGTPVAVIEAQATGIPVISTRHAGIPDVVVDGETGVLVDEHDVDGMARAMLRFADDPGLAATMGKAGRERVREHFRTEMSIGKLAEVLAKASGGRLRQPLD